MPHVFSWPVSFDLANTLEPCSRLVETAVTDSSNWFRYVLHRESTEARRSTSCLGPSRWPSDQRIPVQGGFWGSVGHKAHPGRDWLQRPSHVRIFSCSFTYSYLRVLVRVRCLCHTPLLVLAIPCINQPARRLNLVAPLPRRHAGHVRDPHHVGRRPLVPDVCARQPLRRQQLHRRHLHRGEERRHSPAGLAIRRREPRVQKRPAHPEMDAGQGAGRHLRRKPCAGASVPSHPRPFIC